MISAKWLSSKRESAFAMTSSEVTARPRDFLLRSWTSFESFLEVERLTRMGTVEEDLGGVGAIDAFIVTPVYSE